MSDEKVRIVIKRTEYATEDGTQVSSDLLFVDIPATNELVYLLDNRGHTEIVYSILGAALVH